MERKDSDGASSVASADDDDIKDANKKQSSK